MVERVSQDKALPEEVAAQIVAKTDGVPLFVEELTKTVLESGLLQDAGDHYELTGPLPPLAIPATLHDSLLARLDRLAPGQGDRADRRRDRPRVLPRAARRGRRPVRGGAAGRPRPAGRIRAGVPPRHPARGDLHSSTRWSRTPPTAPSSSPAASSSMPASPRSSKTRFPETAETQPEILAYHCKQAGLIREGSRLTGTRPGARRWRARRWSKPQRN